MKRGRPQKQIEPLAVARVVGKLGGTDAQLAEALSITPQALNGRKRAGLLSTLKAAKAEADAQVEKSLFQRATGYSHEDTYFSQYEGVVTATPYTKHYAPDVVACIFWLKNRKPAEWRERSDAQINITQIAGVPDQVLAGLRRLAALSANEGK